MRPGIDSAWIAALQAAGITTAYLVRLDFESATVFIWTGSYSIQVPTTGDALLDGNTFHPFEAGVMTQVGDNAFSYTGSEAFEMVLSVPASIPQVMAEASLSASEYLARPATIWRAIMIASPGVATPAQWLFRRIRSGSMDNLEITHAPDGVTFKLSVEAYASAATNASQSRWLDQKKFAPTDASQDYAASAQNAEPGKTSTVARVIDAGGGLMRVFKGQEY